MPDLCLASTATKQAIAANATDPSCTLDELEDEIATLSAHIDAATYRLLIAIAEFDRREGWSCGFLSCAHWLSYRVGLDLVTAREKVRVARALEGLPRIGEAFRSGRLSYSKVRAMTRIATPDNEEELLRIARDGTASHLERVVRGYRRTCRLEEAEEAERQHEDRYLHYHTDDDGMLVIEARLPPEVGACVLKALEAAMDALVDTKRIEGREAQGTMGPPGPSVSEEREIGGESEEGEGERTPVSDSAESSGESGGEMGCRLARGLYSGGEVRDRVPRMGLKDDSAESHGTLGLECRQEVALGTESTARALRGTVVSEPTGCLGYDSAESSSGGIAPAGDFSARGLEAEGMSLAQLRADALGLLAEAALGNGLDHMERGEAYHVAVHVDAEVLADPGQDGRSEVEPCTGVSAESSRRLACDAPAFAVVHGANGEVLRVGRKSRRISLPLWRTLAARDESCRFPGCERHRHLQAHHVRHWASGGETRQENLVLLCRAHHRAVHEGGYGVELDGEGGLTFIRPDGRALPRSPEPLTLPADPTGALAASHLSLGLRITPETNQPGWDGQGMDMDLAVGNLLSLESGREAEAPRQPAAIVLQGGR